MRSPTFRPFDISTIVLSKYRRIRKASGLLGRALQHEIDHLAGVLFTERIRDLSTLKDYRAEVQSEELAEPKI